MMGARSAGASSSRGGGGRPQFKKLVEQRMREMNALRQLDLYRAALQEQRAQYDSVDNNSATPSVSAMVDETGSVHNSDNNKMVQAPNRRRSSVIVAMNQRASFRKQNSYLHKRLAAQQPSPTTAEGSSRTAHPPAPATASGRDADNDNSNDNDRDAHSPALKSPRSSFVLYGDGGGPRRSVRNLMDHHHPKKKRKSSKLIVSDWSSTLDNIDIDDDGSGKVVAVVATNADTENAPVAGMTLDHAGNRDDAVVSKHHQHAAAALIASSHHKSHRHSINDTTMIATSGDLSKSTRRLSGIHHERGGDEADWKAHYGYDDHNESGIADMNDGGITYSKKQDDKGELNVHARNMNCCQRILYNVNNFRKACGAFVNHEKVQIFMIMLIVVNAIMMGVGTFNFVDNSYNVSRAFEISDTIFLIAFSVELSFQFIYHGFGVVLDPWLFFDVFIVVVSWSLENFQVVRAFRIFRAFRLVTRLQILKNLVVALFAVAPSMSAIISLLMLIIYIYSVLCTVLFQDLYTEGYLDVDYFGTLDASLFTLFQMMTLDWSDIARQVMVKYKYSWLIFMSYLIVTSFILYSLIIAVVCDAVKVTEHLEENEAQMDGQLNNTERIATLQKRVYELGNGQARILQTLNEVMVMLHDPTIDFDDNDDGLDVDDDSDDNESVNATDQATKSSKRSLLGFLSL